MSYSILIVSTVIIWLAAPLGSPMGSPMGLPVGLPLGMPMGMPMGNMKQILCSVDYPSRPEVPIWLTLGPAREIKLLRASSRKCS